ncbi:hypothetical protein V496_00563 [Pseudogymnoascus sp. VKM F-4515 (FW-2607)]|nr:hypothetical protein V496_00563 [Pseudogymnoascus sp. VKM F-4515 (FW-2607)]
MAFTTPTNDLNSPQASSKWSGGLYKEHEASHLFGCLDHHTREDTSNVDYSIIYDTAVWQRFTEYFEHRRSRQGASSFGTPVAAAVQGMDFIGVDYRNGPQRHGYERVGNCYSDI